MVFCSLFAGDYVHLDRTKEANEQTLMRLHKTANRELCGALLTLFEPLEMARILEQHPAMRMWNRLSDLRSFQNFGSTHVVPYR